MRRGYGALQRFLLRRNGSKPLARSSLVLAARGDLADFSRPRLESRGASDDLANFSRPMLRSRDLTDFLRPRTCAQFSTAPSLGSASASPNPSSQERPRSSPPPPHQEPPSRSPWIRAKLKNLVQDLQSVPPLAKSLGVAGLIPFVALAPPMAYILPLPDLLASIDAAEAQAAYGALILSFLGGPHWGLAMAEGESSDLSRSTARYIWSVIPCLLGWIAMLLPPASRVTMIISSLALALAVDFAMASRDLVPRWYLPLRILLTAIAILSLGSTLLLLIAKSIPRKLEYKLEEIEKSGPHK